MNTFDYYYLTYLVFATFLAIFLNKQANRSKFIILLIIASLCIFSTLLIDSSPGSDVFAYELAMTTEHSTPVYDSEWLFWYGIRFLYKIVDSAKVTWLIMFVINAVSLNVAFNIFFEKKNRTSKRDYFYMLLMYFSLPVLATGSNIRWLLATNIMLISYGYLLRKKYMVSLPISIASILVHNSVIILLPLILFGRSLKFILVSAFTYTIFGLSIGLITNYIFIDSSLITNLNLKFNYEVKIGEQIHYYYAIVMLFMTILIFILNKKYFLVRSEAIKNLILLFGIYLLLMGFISNKILERIFLFITYYILFEFLINQQSADQSISNSSIKITHYFLFVVMIVPFLIYI